jgi:hypothetical protein
MGALITVAALSTQAATVTERYNNDNDITHLFLWSDDPSNMTFVSVDLSDAKLAGWSSNSSLSGEVLMAQGPEVKNSTGKFDITFNYSTAPFIFQYAEVFFQAGDTGPSILDTGMIEYNGKKLLAPTVWILTSAQLNYINASVIGAAVVPIPSSVYLMMSAIGFVGFATRRTNDAMG